MTRLGPSLVSLSLSVFTGSARALPDADVGVDVRADAGTRQASGPSRDVRATEAQSSPAAVSSAPRRPSGEAPPSRVVHPDGASEGDRDLPKVQATLRKLVVSQPYGKTWRELAHTAPVPYDRGSVGDATAHGALKNDAVEAQQQSQYLEPTATTVRFGFASIQGVRVFRFGKLRALRLVVDQAGRPERAAFASDVEALSVAWSAPLDALKLAGGFAVARNDLVDQKKKRPSAWPEAPLVIELVPRERGAR